MEKLNDSLFCRQGDLNTIALTWIYGLSGKATLLCTRSAKMPPLNKVHKTGLSHQSISIVYELEYAASRTWRQLPDIMLSS